MNSLLESIKRDNNTTTTFNGGITHKSTTSKVLDLFALGGAYRTRSEADVIQLFRDAYNENKLLATKCLFYLRDIRGGQGERRFFRICLKWLLQNDPETATMNILNIPEFGRYDDLFTFYDTPYEKIAMGTIARQLLHDLDDEHPSLLAKWMKSGNASSEESARIARKTRNYMQMNAATYRRMLSILRNKINIVESKMSANEWPEIQYDKLPSKAGFQYRKAFKRHDYDRYSQFMTSKETKVHSSTLYPYEVVARANHFISDKVERNTINKYWENLEDYFKDANLDALAMIDTSGSMHGRPMDVAISLGLYLAEKAKGPFHNHYISFSRTPRLVEIQGFDFCEKVYTLYRDNLCENTNIEAAFDLLLNTAIKHHLSQSDMPENIIVISDMEFDDATAESINIPGRGWTFVHNIQENTVVTTMEIAAKKWENAGYKIPNLIFWNVNAMQNNVPMLGDSVSFVSGFSPTIFDTIVKGKTGYELMVDKLNSSRYECIKVPN